MFAKQRAGNMVGVGILVVWVGVLCFPRPGSAQLSFSKKTLYLLSGPEVLYSETATPLAVTVLADSPVTVTAQLSQGNANLALTRDTFQGGLTRVLTLPPVNGSSLSQNGPLNLVVIGHQADKLIFTNSTWLSISNRTVSTFIQTDRARYRPGETVRIRTVSVRLDNRPYRGKMEISVRNPGGETTRRWDSEGSHLGIVTTEFHLSESATLGHWSVTTTVNGITSEGGFIVERYETPSFEVLVRTAPEVLVGDDISGTVRTQPLHEKAVPRTLTVTISLKSPMYNSGKLFTLNQTKEIHGSAQFFFGKDHLPALHEYSSTDGDGVVTLYIGACVTESSTGLKQSRTVEVHMLKNKFQLKFLDFPRVLKPSLSFSARLEISRYDRRLLSAADLMNSALVRVTQETPNMVTEPKTMTLPLVEGGYVLIKLTLEDQVQEVTVQAKFMSSEETLQLFSKFLSPSGSYIQILPISSLPAQIGSPLQIHVESTFQLGELHYVVSSKGQVVTAGTEAASSFITLIPKLSWFPEACVTVYCVLSDGEVVNHTVHVPIQQANYVSLNWNLEQDTARPGDQVSLTVTVLEPGSQVGILVAGGVVEDGTSLEDWYSNTEEDSNTVVLTNGRLRQAEWPGQHEIGDQAFQRRRQWSHWMDQGSLVTWLYLDTNVSDLTWVSPRFTVPDNFTSWRAMALVMSADLGLGLTAIPQRLTVSQEDMTLSMDVPECLVQGEEIVLDINVINHLQWDVEIILLVAQSEAYEFVLSGGGISVANVRKVTVGSQGTASALFPIRPLAMGDMEISVDALSAESSDALVRTVLVKPPGVESSFSQTLFLELAPLVSNSSRAISFSFPPDVVPGSQRVHVAVVGDILALSIGGLESLVDLPLGCGEQTLVRFAPSLFVLQYLDKLDKSPLANREIRRRALAIMTEGYQKELSYQHADGSFSAFGASDESGSTWLTAYVLRCFLQAQPFMQMDQSVLSRAMVWLMGNQKPQGYFTEAGQVIHTELKRCLEDCPVALTAFVLMTLLEDQIADVYRDNVSRAVSYLEDSFSRGVVSNYTLCLMAYALAMANRPAAATVLDELRKRADYTDVSDGVVVWTTPDVVQGTNDWQPHSTQIEMVSYVLLALLRRGMIDGIPLMKWLTRQRNHLGGYGSTQDTGVALQALAGYAAFSGANAINASVTMNASTSTAVSYFIINSTTYLQYQSQEIDAVKDVSIALLTEGRGFALFQMNIFYNIKNAEPSQRLQRTTDREAFSLDVDVIDNERDPDNMALSICTSLLKNRGISQTGMVIVHVDLLSGVILAPQAAVPTDLIRKVETSPGAVSLYLDSLTLEEVCITLPLIRRHKVARMQDAAVRVYDYYEPGRKAMRTYNSELLHNMDSCSFCGRGCSHCRAGISIHPSSFSYSDSSATYSFGCLLALMTMLLLLTLE